METQGCLSEEEEHVLEHLRSVPAARRELLVRLVIREERRLTPEQVDEMLARVVGAWSGEMGERILREFWEMRGHLPNGQVVDGEYLRGGHVVG